MDREQIKYTTDEEIDDWIRRVRHSEAQQNTVPLDPVLCPGPSHNRRMPSLDAVASFVGIVMLGAFVMVVLLVLFGTAVR